MTLNEALAQARRELRESMLYAFANSDGCACPHDPRLEWVNQLDDALKAGIEATR